MNTLDKRARKILFDTHWKSGWIDSANRSVLADDFAYAKSKQLMFDPLTIAHDALVAQTVSLVKRMPVHKPATAFLCSLSGERPDWRSGLASWHLAQVLGLHHYQDEAKVKGHSYNAGVATPHVVHSCAICGADGIYEEEDLNVLNFERIRWGGMRHGKWIYTWLDLQQLHAAEIPEPTPADLAIFEAILETIASSAPSDHPGSLRDRLAPVLRANKEQRAALLEILAAAGVLRPGSTDRRSRGRGGDWTFVASWRGEDGYDRQALRRYFGHWNFGLAP